MTIGLHKAAYKKIMVASVRVTTLRGFDKLIESLGGDAAKLCSESGLDVSIFKSADGLMAYEKQLFLLEHCATELNTPDLGLRVSKAQDMEVLGPLAVAMQNSTSISDAMNCAAAYMYVVSPALKLDIEDADDGTELRVAIHLPRVTPSNAIQAYDKTIAMVYRVLSLLAKEQFEPLAVFLPHRALCSPETYEQHFKIPVHFDADRCALKVSKACMAINLESGNEHIKQIALDYLRQEYPAPEAPFTEQVEMVILRTLGTDSCNRENVSSALALHPKTMQRQLQAEGASFNHILDKVRQKRADYYLRRTKVPLVQVAALIGYSDQTTLSRSCMRWFGVPPRKLRSEPRQSAA